MKKYLSTLGYKFYNFYIGLYKNVYKTCEIQNSVFHVIQKGVAMRVKRSMAYNDKLAQLQQTKWSKSPLDVLFWTVFLPNQVISRPKRVFVIA